MATNGEDPDFFLFGHPEIPLQFVLNITNYT